jgi:hypothetical protein
VLRKYRENGIIHLSDYNIHPERTSALISLMDEIGISYRVDKYYGDDQYQGGWIDPGEMVSYQRTEDELRNVFKNCGIIKNGGCWRLYKGKIHICTRSARCADEGIDLPSDYIDMHDSTTTLDEKSNKLRSLIDAEYIMACDYCAATLGTKDPDKRIAAGTQ